MNPMDAAYWFGCAWGLFCGCFLMLIGPVLYYRSMYLYFKARYTDLQNNYRKVDYK